MSNMVDTRIEADINHKTSYRYAVKTKRWFISTKRNSKFTWISNLHIYFVEQLKDQIHPVTWMNNYMELKKLQF